MESAGFRVHELGCLESVASDVLSLWVSGYRLDCSSGAAVWLVMDGFA